MGQSPAEDLHQMVGPTANPHPVYNAANRHRRLNSKLKARDIEINDLITDLSDGVSRAILCAGGIESRATNGC